MLYLYISIILLALWGLFTTFRIYIKKKSPEPMVCPLGADCHAVVKSEFSSFFGIGLEVFGAAYYGMIIIAYSLAIFVPSIFNDWATFILFGFTMSAFLFSVYLTFVQAFLIKSWCSWCLISASISTAIFALAITIIVNSGISFVPILTQIKPLIIILHLTGFALGVGGATITDILFFKFLKDFNISSEENKILKIMSQIIWFGLLIVVISGLGLFLQDMETLMASSKFLLKILVVVIIILNGSLLNLFVHPKLIRMNIGSTDNNNPKVVLDVKKTTRLRKIAFASGAISFISWYTAFVLGSLDNVLMTFWNLLYVYISLIIIAVLFSQLFEKLYSRKTKQNI